jgi:hypothetical protein
MARKQTLKSLLGGNDSRVEVDLNLDEQTFQAPTVRAGNYSVAAPVYAKTNALSQLSDSLERYSGPILKGYANIKEQQSIAMADASELLTREQLQLLNDGDSSGLKDSINNDKRQIDEAQRKKLISFAENPNNYERAYRRVGSRVAGVFTEDYLTNMDKYAEDESFDFQAKADELAEKYGLNGLGEQEFYKQINNISESTKARFGELKNAHMVRTDKAEAISDQSQQIINGTFNTDVIAEGGFYDAMAGKTLAQQEAIVQGMVTKLAAEHPKKALELIESYETGVIALGNGKIRDEFADSLEDAAGNAQNRQDELAEIVERKRKESIDAAYTTVTNAIAFDNVEMPDSVDIKINEGITLTIDTSEVTNEAEFSQAVADAVMAVEEDDKTFSSTLKNEVMGYFRKGIAEGQTKQLTFRTKAGVEAADSELSSIFGAQDPQGNYIYEDVVDATSHNALLREKRAELTDIVDAIYNDPSLDLIQKDSLAKNAVGEFIAKEKELLVTRKAELAEVKLETERFEATGGDMVPSLMSIFNAYSVATGEEKSVSLTDQENRRKIAREKGAEIDVEREKILNREQTPDELASNMSDAEFEKLKRQEASDYVDDQKDYFKKDLGYDGEINDIFEERQDAKEQTKEQERLAKGTKKAKVKINEGGTFGLFESPDYGNPMDMGPKEFQAMQDNNKIRKAANATKNLIQDLTISTEDGHMFNMGLKDNFNRRYMRENIDDPNVQTLHEIHHWNAKAFQEGGYDAMETTSFQGFTQEGRDALGPHFIGEFIQGETIIRVARDGAAGMTLNEVENGNIKGVKFDAKTLNHSVTPILPFALLNKALTDDDNLTPQEEQQVRDYADALYDTGALNDKGREDVINKMVELQVNAYTLLGFQFGK